MLLNIMLDGTELAECHMFGKHRHGILRVAEEITKRLVSSFNCRTSFANTKNIYKYHFELESYLSKNYFNNDKVRLLSSRPNIFSKICKKNGFFHRNPNLMPRKIKVHNIQNHDIFHSFYYPFIPQIQQSSVKKSITLHDIIPLKYFGYSSKAKNFTKSIIESIIPNFAIAVSAFSKQDLLEYDSRVKEEQICVAHIAASPFLFYRNTDQSFKIKVQNKYSLPEKYFLVNSNPDIRKNVKHVIKSFEQFLLQERYKDIFLLITGNSKKNHRFLDELAIKKEVRNQIKITDTFIDEEDLSVVYSNAICFIFMSEYEGFGLPPLEAMQCGTPVIASNITSIPEIVGDAGILIPPKDMDTLCDKMNLVYNSNEISEQLSQKGLERAKLFSWQTTTKKYLDWFKKIT